MSDAQALVLLERMKRLETRLDELVAIVSMIQKQLERLGLRE